MNVIGSAIGRVFGAAASGATAFGRGVGMVFGRAASSWGALRLWGTSRIDWGREAGDPLANSAVVAVIDWLARNFAEAPVRITSEDAGGELTEYRRGPSGAGRFLRLMENPNGRYDGATLWNATMVDLCISADAYWLKQRDDFGRVIAYWWAPAGTMTPRGTAAEFLTHYDYNPNGTVYALDPEDVVHFQDGMNPDDPRRGRSKMQALLREVFTDNEAAAFTAQLLRNLGVPGVVIAPSNTNTGNVKVDKEAIKQSYRDKFGGDNRGEPMVLSSAATVTILSWSPKDLNLADIRRLPEERISAVYGIPAVVAQLGAGLEHSTFTNYGEARAAAYEEGVIPRQRVMASALEVQALPDFVDVEAESFDVGFDLRKVRAMAAYTDAEWKRLSDAARTGLITRADWKRGVGRPVAKDGSDDVYVFPGNYVILDAADGTDPTFVPAKDVAAPANAAPETAALGAGPVFEAGPIRCGGEHQGRRCGRLLAERATFPYRLRCPRCKTIAEAAAPELAAA